MTEPFEKAGQEAAAFQKMWLENFTKVMQAAFNFTPDTAPPDVLRQIRAGIFQTLAQSWDEYMRSPQFLEATRQWMDNAVTFRKITNEFMGRVRNDIQAPSRSDIDTVMLAVRHMEKRLLDRLDELSAHLGSSNGKTSKSSPADRGTRSKKPRRSSRPKSVGRKAGQ
ncbi:MAG TPA: hypothetical protein VL860_00435 [Planctomycetota bacterium]|jgi:hypothetical protein|nr:hypothetical protein [Planctomycetota bacterium]